MSLFVVYLLALWFKKSWIENFLCQSLKNWKKSNKIKKNRKIFNCLCNWCSNVSKCLHVASESCKSFADFVNLRYTAVGLIFFHCPASAKLHSRHRTLRLAMHHCNPTRAGRIFRAPYEHLWRVMVRYESRTWPQTGEARHVGLWAPHPYMLEFGISWRITRCHDHP